MSRMQGGSFVSGFISGAISSGMASGAEALHLGPVMMIAVGGISGGVASAASGGSFWDGARQGLITSGLNHVAHMAVDGGGGEGEGSGDPPCQGDKKQVEGQGGSKFEYTFDGNEWQLTGIRGASGGITPTDSPIEWALTAWKTPFAAADDVALLGFAKITGGNSMKIVSKGMSYKDVTKIISK